MRKAYLLFTLLMIGLASCKPNRNDKPTTYAVSNVHDIALTQGQMYSYDIYLDYLGPVQEKVSLSITGLPTGISFDISKPSGIPSFGSTITLRNNSAEPGVYPCVLHTKGEQTGEKMYEFNVNVVTEPLCGVLGTYAYTMVCDTTGAGATTESLIAASTPVANTVNPVKFQNFGRRGWNVTADINCSNNTVSVPLQPVGGGLQVSGQGTFTSTGMNINYTVYSAGPAQVCNFTILKSN